MPVLTVDTDGTSGDYSSLNAALGSLGAMTEDATITCYASTSVDDSTAVAQNLNTGIYRITVTAGDANYRLRRDISTDEVIDLGRTLSQLSNITFRGLNIVGHGHSGSLQDTVRLVGIRNGEQIVFDSCVIETETHTFQDDIIFISCPTGWDTTIIFVNCLIRIGSSSVGSSRFFNLQQNPDCYVYNCTMVQSGGGGAQLGNGGGTENVFVNNIVAGASALGLTTGTSSNYNATDAAWDTGGANDRQSQTFTFVDTVGYRLASGDAGARDFGTDLSADSVYAFSDDIDGNTRPASWDIGASEYVVAGVTVAPTSSSRAAATVNPTTVLGSISSAPAARSAARATVIGAVILGALALTASASASPRSTVDPAVVAGSIVVAPAVASRDAGTAGPTVELGALSLAPATTSAARAVSGPAVVLGALALVPDVSGRAASSLGPAVVLGSTSAAPAASSRDSATAGPDVALSSMVVAPAFSASASATIDPTVAIGSGTVTVSPDASSGIRSTVAPTVALGATTATPTASDAARDTDGPAVVLGSVSVAPALSASPRATIDPTVSIADGSVSVAPATSGSIRTTANPAIILGSISLAPAANAAARATIDPAILGAYRLVAHGSWSDAAEFLAGDEFYVTLTGTAVDSPDVVLVVYLTAQ